MNAAPITAADLVANAFKGSAYKRQWAQIILDEFRVAGFPAGVALAAVANAEAESGLNPFAEGDHGHSIGLFQINDIRGTVQYDFDRTDARANTRWIIKEYDRLDKKSGQIGNYTTSRSLDQYFQDGVNLADMTAEFAAIVERPGDIEGEKYKRRGIARSLFGGYANHPARSFEYGGRSLATSVIEDPDLRESALRRYWWYALGFGVLGTAFVFGLRRALRR
jgi:hypothetical protein